MSSSNFLVFFLGLLVLCTANTAEQNESGGAAFTEPTSKPHLGLMYSRGWRKIKNHPPESTGKSREGVVMQEQKLKPAAAMQIGQEKRRLEDRSAVAFPTVAGGAMLKKVGMMVGDKPAGFSETDMQKLEKASKYYNAGARRASNAQKVQEGGNQ